MMHWVSAIGGLLTATFIIYLVRRDHLHTRYALWWVPAAFGIAILGVFPQLSDWVASKLGIGYGPIIPLLAGLIILTLKVLMMDIERSKNETKLYRVVQKLAILEQELLELRELTEHKNNNLK